MAVQAGDKIQRSTLVTLYNNMIEEAFANRLGVGSIGSHFASGWSTRTSLWRKRSTVYTRYLQR